MFDDTDRWIPDDDADTVDGFFRDIIRWLTDLPVSVVVAAHRRYLDNGSRRRYELLEFLDTQVAIPRLEDATALATILERRIALKVVDIQQHHGAQLNDAVTGDGVSVPTQTGSRSAVSSSWPMSPSPRPSAATQRYHRRSCDERLRGRVTGLSTTPRARALPLVTLARATTAPPR